MKLEEAARIVGGEIRPGSGRASSRTGGWGAVEISDLAYDSRQAVPGALFFCIRGAHSDGHLFAADAIRAGAVAVVCERALDLGVPQIVVPDSFEAMNTLAAPFFRFPTSQVDLVGVSGTNGKTTTAYMLESIFKAGGANTGLIGTVETRIGRQPPLRGDRTTPESIDLQRLLAKMAASGVTKCAMEVTSIGLERGRVQGCRFQSVIFTNLSQDHLDYHRTYEAYYQAKRRLFSRSFSPAAAINADDEYGRRLLLETELKTLSFGIGPAAELRAEEIRVGPAGSAFKIRGHGLDLRVTIPLPGTFNILNGLAAAGGALLSGEDPAAIARGLSEVGPVPGRLERVEAGQDFSVFVDYAHTPAALEALIAAVRETTSGSRLLLVFGCGGDRDRAKRAVMGQIAGRADFVIATSDNPRSENPLEILAAVRSGMDQNPPPEGYMVIEDRRAAIEEALARARPSDAVVIAGKGHETGQEAAGVKHPFDDRQVALIALKRISAT